VTYQDIGDPALEHRGSPIIIANAELSDIAIRAQAVAQTAGDALNGRLPKRAALRAAVKFAYAIYTVASGKGLEALDELPQISIYEARRRMTTAAFDAGGAA
jgi:hypothetical protein